MTPERKAAISAAAIEHHRARERMNMLRSMNRAADPDQAVKQSIEYALAEAILFETAAALGKLQEPAK